MKERGNQLQLRDGHFKKPIVFSLAGWDVAVFLAALYELHTHFVLSELNQEPRRRKKTDFTYRWKKKVVSDMRRRNLFLSFQSVAPKDVFFRSV